MGEVADDARMKQKAEKIKKHQKAMADFRYGIWRRKRQLGGKENDFNG